MVGLLAHHSGTRQTTRHLAPHGRSWPQRRTAPQGRQACEVRVFMSRHFDPEEDKGIARSSATRVDNPCAAWGIKNPFWQSCMAFEISLWCNDSTARVAPNLLLTGPSKREGWNTDPRPVYSVYTDACTLSEELDGAFRSHPETQQLAARSCVRASVICIDPRSRNWRPQHPTQHTP